MEKDSKITLNNGIEMPIFGLGTYQIRSNKAVQIFHTAFDLGYRHIDTAAFYGNEKEVGEAIQTSSIPRKELFVTTKLWNSDHGYNRALEAFKNSFDKLGLQYIDLYLIHWPVTNKRVETWKALESLLETGQIRAIGVSNFMIHHLEELLDNCSIIPAVNQVEFHPYLYRKKLLDYCRENRIQLGGYSPLVKGRKLNDPKLEEIAKKYSKTPAQILIKWSLQKKVITIPKSSNEERLKENIDVFNFKIAKEDMISLDSFSEDFAISWDPRTVP